MKNYDRIGNEIESTETMKTKMTKALGLCVLAGMIVAGTVGAQSNEALLKTLVKKGVITEAEAEALRKEVTQDSGGAVPEWVQSISFKGDLRLRYEQAHKSIDGGNPARNRFRYRFRYGATADLKNNFKVGFRFASGSTSNPISTNTTMDDDGQNDTLAIDQAYASWSDAGFTMYGGKMPNHSKTGWFLDNAIIDTDYTPEGVELHYVWDVGSKSTLGLNYGFWVIDEVSTSSHDAYLNIAQAVFATQLTADTEAQLGLGTYSVSGFALRNDGSVGTGNTIGQGFTPIMLDGALSFKTSFAPVKLFGTWLENQQAEANDNAWRAGLKLGSAKKAGQWELSYEYRVMEADSTYDQLSESDFGAIKGSAYEGGTNIKGHIIKARYNIYDNWQTGLSLYNTEPESGSGDSNNCIQLDFVWKF